MAGTFQRKDQAMKIKLIVSQAFFLGKPMLDAAFFCKPQPQLVSDQKTQASHTKPQDCIKLV